VDKQRTTKRLAAVLGPIHGASTIDVRFTWVGVDPGIDSKEQRKLESVLYSWVLTQLQSSKQWRTANIFVQDERTPRRALLGAATRRRRLWEFAKSAPTRLLGIFRPKPETFLAPVVHIRPW